MMDGIFQILMLGLTAIVWLVVAFGAILLLAFIVYLIDEFKHGR